MSTKNIRAALATLITAAQEVDAATDCDIFTDAPECADTVAHVHDSCGNLQAAIRDALAATRVPDDSGVEIYTEGPSRIDALDRAVTALRLVVASTHCTCPETSSVSAHRYCIHCVAVDAIEEAQS